MRRSGINGGGNSNSISEQAQAKRKRWGLLASAAAAVASFMGRNAEAATSITWTGTSTGTWFAANNSNWNTTSTVPWNATNGPTNIAVFNSAANDGATINGSVYVGGITWGSLLPASTVDTIGGGTINLAGSTVTLDRSAAVATGTNINITSAVNMVNASGVLNFNGSDNQNYGTSFQGSNRCARLGKGRLFSRDGSPAWPEPGAG